MKRYFFSYLLLIFIFVCAQAQAVSSILDMPLPDLQGQMRQLSEWKGRVMVVNIWATWCPPCREEIPAFIRLQKQLMQKNVQFIGIAVDDKNPVTDFARAYSINYPILLGGDETMMLLRLYGNRMGVVPQTLIFDSSGQLVISHIGLLEEKELLDYLKPLFETPL